MRLAVSNDQFACGEGRLQSRNAPELDKPINAFAETIYGH